MNPRWISVLAIVVAAHGARADEPKKIRGDVSSINPVGPGAIEPGAVYEVKLKVRAKQIKDYVGRYARWYLPIDQFVCDETIKRNNQTAGAGDICESSGRKVVSVLTREFGDEHGLVFLYRYESAYKDDFYCKYAKAFIEYHAAHPPDFEIESFKGVPEAERKRRLNEILKGLPKECSALPRTDETPTERQRAERAALDLALGIVHEVDLELLDMVEGSESSWYLDVNACHTGKLTVDQQARCEKVQRSLLQRAVELKWDAEWQPKQ